MNYRLLIIIVAVILMILAPTVGGMIADGQALKNAKEEEFDKSDLPSVTVDLYITSTGEKRKMALEEYVTCVLLAEVPSYYESEALKALAVAVRSYCLRRIETEKKEMRHFSADVCDDYTHCMGYISLSEASMLWGEDNVDAYYKIVNKAVNETKGEVLSYGGMIADAVFHESSKGVTESAENVWGFEIPYLIAVETPETAVETFVEYTPEELKSILEKEGILGNFNDSPEGWIGFVEKNKNGRVNMLEIAGVRITGRRVREKLGLSSSNFELTCEDGKFRIKTVGSGHGVGMSMEGADCFADKGMDYRDILMHYYPGTELCLFSD